MTLLGKILCYAVVAVAMDLIWGYAGILSLGHGLFFALGGYAFGMYLMRGIGRDGSYQSDLPDFMVFLDWKALPWFWWNSDSFLWSLFLVVAVPGLLAWIFGYFAFRSRIKGVYFSIITQALTYAAMLLFFATSRFGGTTLHRHQGIRVRHHSPEMRSIVGLSACAEGGWCWAALSLQVRPGAGHPDPNRGSVHRLPALHTSCSYGLCPPSCVPGGALYGPGGHHQPVRDEPRQSSRSPLGGVGGRGTWWAGAGGLHREPGEELLTCPSRVWLFFLGSWSWP